MDKDIVMLAASAEFKQPVATGAGGSGSDTVVGAYAVGRALGEGGFGQVRLGHHQITKDEVALKFLSVSAACSPQQS